MSVGSDTNSRDGMAHRASPRVAVDRLDHRIIAELRRDGRQANTEIARRLGTSEGTVRSRIQRLVKAGIIQIAAVTNLPSLGYEIDVVIGVHCEASRALDVAREASTLEGVRYVGHVIGRYDLLVSAFFRSRDDLFRFLTGVLGKIPGVQKTETLQVLRVVRRDYDYWESPLTE